MRCVRIGCVRLRHWLVVAGAILGILSALGSGPAEARFRRHHGSGNYQPAYADIVVDANSGKVLHSTNADGPRHPASLTKIMTLYLLFEQLDAGRLRLDSRMQVSAHAATQAPTKLGLDPGDGIEVSDAIKAVITKSANDIAVVIAETIAGNEDDFAKLMTRRAHELGMRGTTYYNASGLPDDRQITTAQDQALLGRAIQERFPQYYRFFATPVFRYGGIAMRNHNRLLGEVEGVDGIKTGYTHDSGFNLVSSMRRGNRHLVAVVLGGSSGSARDARMRSLLEEYVADASTKRTVAMVATASETPVSRPRAIAAPAADHTTHAASLDSLTAAAAAEPDPAPSRPGPGSSDPIQPMVVKTISVKSGPIAATAVPPLVVPVPQSNVPPAYWVASASSRASSAPAQGASTSAAAPAPDPTAAPTSAASSSAASSQSPVEALEQVAAQGSVDPHAPGSALPPPPGARPGVLGVLPAGALAMAEAEPAAAESNNPAVGPNVGAGVGSNGRSAHDAHGGEWMIQVGAFEDEGQARDRLKLAQSIGKAVLGKADPFTERVVVKGTKELYRARFAGLDKETAEAACLYFKRNEIACLALRN